ncbi:MAG: hypothetical protein F6K19_45120 [Cyanothece sp. SIO1E1]|nr:hypothetical protein [Cyanothece sp. SIO1E1]
MTNQVKLRVASVQRASMDLIGIGNPNNGIVRVSLNCDSDGLSSEQFQGVLQLAFLYAPVVICRDIVSEQWGETSVVIAQKPNSDHPLDLKWMAGAFSRLDEAQWIVDEDGLLRSPKYSVLKDSQLEQILEESRKPLSAVI